MENPIPHYSPEKEQSWFNKLAEALNVLGSSVTGVRYHPPSLSNAEYRALAQRALQSASDRILFESYDPKLNSDPGEVVQILRSHPTIENALAGSNDDAVMMLTPSTAFRVELNRLALYLSKAAMKRDGQYAAGVLRDYLTFSEEGRLPGYEVALFRGLEVDRRFDIGEGSFIAPYDELVQDGLLNEPRHLPDENFPDYHKMGAVGLVRSLTWGPGIAPAMTGATLFAERAPQVSFNFMQDRDGLGIAFDVLSIVTRCPLEILWLEDRASKFMEDIDPNFNSGSGTHFSPRGFSRSLLQEGNVLTSENERTVAELLSNWPQGDAIPRHVPSRIASAVSRSGRFGRQDSILDLSIALESMYKEERDSTYKLATRAGYFLGSDAKERIKKFKAVRSFYRVRSHIVHGKDPSRQTTEKALEEGFLLARDTFFGLLRGARPTDWDVLVMSGSEV